MVTGLGKLNAWAQQSYAARAQRFAGSAALVGGAVFLALSFIGV